MIGVIATASDMTTVREFFELFKTPWEPWNPTRYYDVVLCSTDHDLTDIHTGFLVVYSGSRLTSDPVDAVEELSAATPTFLTFGADLIPVYGACVAFPLAKDASLKAQSTGHPVAYSRTLGDHRRILRAGYDLFQEIEPLLRDGQPPAQAAIPTVELHIDFLRHQIQSAGIPFVEIPPTPHGHAFTVCLTHDIDHPAMKLHVWDHTAAGFLFRATLGTFTTFLRGQTSFQALMTNWTAAAKWPFVQLGLARDPWADFHHQYRDIEDGLPSTYFIIPQADNPGRTLTGQAHKYRAAAYAPRNIEGSIRDILRDGCEIGLHGIDAWLDRDSAHCELETIRTVTRLSKPGVRMHWLFLNDASPQILEDAGANYDSTMGYRETVGFRSGTTQAYIPPGARSLLELPLHAMDVALLFPQYLGLNSDEATSVLLTLAETTSRFGGCLTVNWHDRSLAPERLWSACYQSLLKELKSRGVWFATCGQAVRWFQKRRSVNLEGYDLRTDSDLVRGLNSDDTLPPLILRTYTTSHYALADAGSPMRFEDTPIASHRDEDDSLATSA
jgi:hypothetical protein